MKIPALILSIVVLILSSMPCSDINAMLWKERVQVVKADDMQNETNHSDACTPFCQCSCCAGFAVNHTIADLKITPITHKILYSEFYIARLISIALPVWQPPQIT